AGKDALTLATDLLAMEQAEFSAAFRKSPMKRAKLKGLQRNAAVVLRNGDGVGTEFMMTVSNRYARAATSSTISNHATILSRITCAAGLATVLHMGKPMHPC